MPLGKIPGVGKITLAKLNQLGLFSCEDVQQYNQHTFIQQFGKFGQVIWQCCHGIDERAVQTSRMRKSVGVERTLVADISSMQDCLLVMQNLYAELEKRLTAIDPNMQIVKQGIKLKFSDFQQTTVEHKQYQYDQANFLPLLQEALTRQEGRGIRLVGLTLGLPESDERAEQLSFDWPVGQ